MRIHLLTAPALASCCLTAVSAQGLMDIGARFDSEVKLPFSFVLNSTAGWDSSPRAGSYEGRGAGAGLSSSGSAFWQNAMSMHLPAGNAQDRFTFNGNISSVWYADAPPGTPSFQLTGGLSGSYVREANDRLSYGDTVSLSRQTEPDYAFGTPVNRPTGGYLTASNRLWLSYDWSTRFTSVTAWSASVIEYDEDTEQAENSIRHVFSQELRYALTTRTTATFSYRYGLNRFDDSPGENSTSHYILLGADRPLGRFFSLSLKSGLQYRSFEGDTGSSTEPYTEAAINYHARVKTTFRWYLRSGMEDSGRPGMQDRSALRTGLSVSQVLAPGLSLNAAVNVVDYRGSTGSETARADQEDLIQGTLGINYSRPLWRKFLFNAGYTYSTLSSDDPLSDYQRHRISIGIGAQF